MDRTAVDSLKGYFYQFDYSISKLLNLKNDMDAITIEGIEDIDINTATENTAIQCKYYSKTEYNHSVIAEPIRLIMIHFSDLLKSQKPLIRYRLHGHYKSGHSKLQLPLTVDYLKTNFLTYKRADIKYEHHNDLLLSDTDLEEFISVLDINIHGAEYNDQYKQVVDQLKTQFECSNFTSEYFYYNSALRIIKDLSIKKNKAQRTITRKEFVHRIDTSKIIFNEWYIKIRGERQHYLELRKEYFSALNISPFERFFLIEIKEDDYVRADLKATLQILSKKWSKLSKREPKPFCPYVYIHNLEPNELAKIKQDLANEGFHINDGHRFYGSNYNIDSMVKSPSFDNEIKLKVVNLLEDIEPTLEKIARTREVYQFFLKDTFFTTTSKSIRHIQIQVKSHNDIKQII